VGENVGSYNVTGGTFSAASANYFAPTFDGSNAPQLTITQAAALTGSLASNPSKTYGMIDPAFGGLPIVLSGQVNNPAIATWNGNVAINDTGAAATTGTLTSLTRVAGENVGGYNYTSGTLSLTGTAAGNYSGAVFVPGASMLNITLAPLTITADDKSRPVGIANPPFTASYAGFQFSETPAVLGGVLIFTTPATIASPAGLYAITPSGQTSTNYTITYVNGTLTVGGLPPNFTGGNILFSQIGALQRTIAPATPGCSRDPTAAATPSAVARAIAVSPGASLSGCSSADSAGLTDLTPGASTAPIRVLPLGDNGVIDRLFNDISLLAPERGSKQH